MADGELRKLTPGGLHILHWGAGGRDVREALGLEKDALGVWWDKLTRLPEKDQVAWKGPWVVGLGPASEPVCTPGAGRWLL